MHSIQSTGPTNCVQVRSRSNPQQCCQAHHLTPPAGLPGPECCCCYCCYWSSSLSVNLRQLVTNTLSLLLLQQGRQLQLAATAAVAGLLAGLTQSILTCPVCCISAQPGTGKAFTHNPEYYGWQCCLGSGLLKLSPRLVQCVPAQPAAFTQLP